MFSIILSKNHSINAVTIHFLTKQPVKEIQWNELFPVLTCDDQEEICQKTVNSELISTFPISIAYQKQFLKTLIDYLELQESVAENAVYDAFGRLVALPSNSNFIFSYYPIKKNDNFNEVPLIILKENVNIISDGTTGLRTWEASLALAEWILQNASYVDKKKILELGSGIGLTGLVVLHATNPSKYILTDCHPSVLSVLRENVEINAGICGEIHENLRVNELSWEKTTEASCREFGDIDVIFAADVVYDKDLYEPLLNTLVTFLKAGTIEAIFACTERNSDTLKSFWKACDEKNLTVEFLKTPEPFHLSWKKNSPIFLARILQSSK